MARHGPSLLPLAGMLLLVLLVGPAAAGRELDSYEAKPCKGAACGNVYKPIDIPHLPKKDEHEYVKPCHGKECGKKAVYAEPERKPYVPEVHEKPAYEKPCLDCDKKLPEVKLPYIKKLDKHDYVPEPCTGMSCKKSEPEHYPARHLLTSYEAKPCKGAACGNVYKPIDIPHLPKKDKHEYVKLCDGKECGIKHTYPLHEAKPAYEKPAYEKPAYEKPCLDCDSKLPDVKLPYIEKLDKHDYVPKPCTGDYCPKGKHE